MKESAVFGLFGVLILVLATVCFSAETMECVAPPNDQDMLHLSVIGIANNAEYVKLVSWFQKDSDLAALRASTHFHAVKAGSAIYDERYAPNISGLPTVRLQDAEGVVLYESAGSNVPRTPALLASAIGKQTRQLFDPPLLPWRRKVQNNCDKNCGPQGEAEITPEDFMDMEEEFVFNEPLVPLAPADEGVPPWVVVLLALGAAGGGFCVAVLGSVKREMGE